MNEENKKEILTRDIIKKDAKSILVYNIFRNTLIYFLLMILPLPFYGVYMISDVSRQKINIIFSLIEIAILLPYVLVIIRYVKSLSLLKKDNFNIVIDKVYDKKVNRWWAYGGEAPTTKPFLSYGVFKTGLILCFEKHKKYDISLGNHYNFSKMNQMIHLQQLWSTELCDEFYLLIIDNKIIEIYNTKLFELKD